MYKELETRMCKMEDTQKRILQTLEQKANCVSSPVASTNFELASNITHSFPTSYSLITSAGYGSANHHSLQREQCAQELHSTAAAAEGDEQYTIHPSRPSDFEPCLLRHYHLITLTKRTW